MFKNGIPAAAIFASALIALQMGFAPPARASFFKKAEGALHKLGESAHDAGVSLGKQVSKTADSATHEILQGGKVVGHAVVKAGHIVEERTVQDGKEVDSTLLQSGKFIVQDGKIVGRDVEIDGKLVGAEIIKDGKVVGHTAVEGGDYVVEKGELLLAPAPDMPLPGDFPPSAAAMTAAQRFADCASAKEPDCYTKVAIPKKLGVVPSNCLYGWSVGAGHPSSNTNPPGYDKMLDAVDQCAWFHDRGAWRFNPNTRYCETYEMCSNSMGLRRCLDRVVPKTPAEAAAKACFTSFFQKAIDVCVAPLYKDWGSELATDASGEQWLSAKSVGELRGAMKRCPRPMKHPGFPGL